MSFCALTVVRDGQPRWRLRLNAQVTLVGRDPKLPGCLNDPKVSRRHAVFVVAPDGSLVMHDLGSRNGVYLNGRRVPTGAQVAIARGDEILAGNTLLLVDGERGGKGASERPPIKRSPQPVGGEPEQFTCEGEGASERPPERQATEAGELCLDEVLAAAKAPKAPKPRRRRVSTSRRGWRRSIRAR